MIDLYYWTTPNGHKTTIFLEEAELPYRIVDIDMSGFKNCIGHFERMLLRLDS